MMIEQIQGYYGTLPEQEQKWISENLEQLSEEQQMNFLHELNEQHGRNQGKPDIKRMAKVLQKVTGQKAKVYFWSVCASCGCEYDYRLTMCPKCYDEGYECRAYTVRQSEFQPPFAKIVRYNKTYIGDSEKPGCYNCVHRKESYCPNFGDPKYTCYEYRECKCAPCCSQHKPKENGNTVTKIDFRKPIRRGVEHDGRNIQSNS